MGPTLTGVTRPVLAALLLLLTGCASTHQAAERSPGPTVTPGATTPAPGPTASATGAATPADTRCHTWQLDVHLTDAGAAAGNRYVKIVLTNRSTSTCYVFGFGGMLLLDAAKHPLPTVLVRAAGSSPHRLKLLPGGTVSSRLHWSDVPTGSKTCMPEPKYAEVTPPDERTFIVTSWIMGPVCDHGRIDQEPYQ